jgi:hypothetical protein
VITRWLERPLQDRRSLLRAERPESASAFDACDRQRAGETVEPRQQRGPSRARRTDRHGRRSPRPGNSRMQGSRICPRLPAYRGTQPSSLVCAELGHEPLPRISSTSARGSPAAWRARSLRPALGSPLASPGPLLLHRQRSHGTRTSGSGVGQQHLSVGRSALVISLPNPWRFLPSCG